MTSPEISVVITTYNRPERIKDAIETVLNQTFKDIEIIVVDGANSRKNRLAVRRVKYNGNKLKYKNIKYVRVEPEAVNYISYKGIQHSRNVGCKVAKGKYIAMLDDDDKWEKNKLEEQYNIFKYGVCGWAKDEIGLVLCATKINMGDKIVVDRTKRTPNYEDLLQSYNLSSTSTYLIRRDILEEVGFWNEKLRGMHEYDIALKLSKLGYKIYALQEPLMYRDRISNITVESGHYYFFKIAEIFDLWHYYGKDFLPNVGIKGFLFNTIKTVVLISLFSFGYIIKERVWNFVYPLKKLHEEVVE